MRASPADLTSLGVSPSLARTFSELIPSDGSAVLAVSGGSDSMALMNIAAALRAGGGWSPALAVCFVDHGLREGVDEEWRLVEEGARRIGLEARRVEVPRERVEEAGEGGSLQEWARDERYALLAAFAREVGASTVATGHTAEDQAETVMLRLLRGTGVDGLGGIPRRRDLGGLEVVRPLLAAGRASLRAMLERVGVPWAEDPSNEDTRFKRVEVRRELIPAMERMSPGIVARLASLALEARGVSDYLGRVVEDERHLVRLRLAGGVRVDARVFDAIPRAFWSRLIRFAARAARGDLRGLERSHLDPIERLLEEGTCTDELPLPGEGGAYAHRGSLLVFGKTLPRKPTGSGQPTATGAKAWSARFAALGASAEIRGEGGVDVSDLEVRAREPGDRLWGSRKKLKEILQAGGVPRPYRDFVPVLVADDQVISSPALLPSRVEGLDVRWVLDERSPILDMDFPITSSDQ